MSQLFKNCSYLSSIDWKSELASYSALFTKFSSKFSQSHEFKISELWKLKALWIRTIRNQREAASMKKINCLSSPETWICIQLFCKTKVSCISSSSSMCTKQFSSSILLFSNDYLNLFSWIILQENELNRSITSKESSLLFSFCKASVLLRLNFSTLISKYSVSIKGLASRNLILAFKNSTEIWKSLKVSMIFYWLSYPGVWFAFSSGY